VTAGGKPGEVIAVGVTVASAKRRPAADSVPANVRPSARQSSPNARVMCTEPSFLGNPWIQPRTSAKSASTQMYGQVVTCSPARLALTTRKNSRYWPRTGSSSSWPESPQDCQSANTAAARPGSGAYGSIPGGSTAATASGSAQYSTTRKSPA